MSDLPLDEAALDRAKKRIEHGDWPADNTLHALVAQSRAALTLRARVAELEAELAITQKYADDCGSLLTRATTERDAAYSHAAKLRDALVKCEDEWRKLGGPLSAWPKGDGRRDTARELADECAAALASTPAASLAAHNAALIERCATAAESYLWNLPAIQSQVGANCGDAIRALAAQEVKP